jgi:pyruvate ferredoxin oxidoreductase beta subunit
MPKSLSIKELSKKEELFTSGHRLCSGCGAPIVVKMVVMAIDYPVVVANATGCLEVSSCISEFTAWKIPWMHSAFENAAASISRQRPCLTGQIASAVHSVRFTWI